jgi:hypothetical protein
VGPHGKVVQVHGFKPCVESTHGFSAWDYNVMSCFQLLLPNSTCAATTWRCAARCRRKHSRRASKPRPSSASSRPSVGESLGQALDRCGISASSSSSARLYAHSSKDGHVRSRFECLFSMILLLGGTNEGWMEQLSASFGAGWVQGAQAEHALQR